MRAPTGTMTERDTGIPTGRIEKWAAAAAAQAVVEPMEAPDGYYAEVAETPGAWGYGETEGEALSVPKGVLVGSASLKLADGDTDIPMMGGVSLYHR